MTIRITSKRDGFRRAGVAHPARPVDHPQDAFTPEQLEALLVDPMLLVEVLEDIPVQDPLPGQKGEASELKEPEAEDGTAGENIPGPQPAAGADPTSPSSPRGAKPIAKASKATGKGAKAIAKKGK